MDNKFEAFISTSDSVVGVLFSSGFSWPTTIVGSFILTPGIDYYLHIAGEDTGAPAGFLGQFSLDSGDHQFSNGSSNLLTNITDWSVNTSGFTGSYGPVSEYGLNSGSQTWGTLPNVSTSATWIWTGDNRGNSKAYFTTKISATSSSVPDGGATVVMLGLSLLGMVGIKGKFRK